MSQTSARCWLGVWLILGASVLYAQPTPEEYRQFGRRHDGDRAVGERLFRDTRTQCAQCHTVDGSARLAGPDLQFVGGKHSRQDLIQAILEPSAAIMMGFSTTVLETKDGVVVEGILKAATANQIVLQDAAGKRHSVPLAEVVRRDTRKLSLMPEGLHQGLSLEEFADLVAYLEGLRQSEGRAANLHGTPGEIPKARQPVSLEPLPIDRVFHKPVWFQEHPVLDHHYLLAEQMEARIWLVSDHGDRATSRLFVNVRDEVFVTDTEGLLGVAMHPNFASNRKYYLMHESMSGTQRSMIIAERTARADLRSDSGAPSRLVLKIDVGTEVHHGGGIEFGPDGYLYIGMGDAGPQEDPEGHGQDLQALAGKLLRIDVDGRDVGLEYRIPPENPFADFRDLARPEILAYGLRQPWRFSFDSVTDELWVGDVGQNRFEEICIVRPGENHGWNVYEGFELFSTQYRRASRRYVMPVVSFSRRHGFSVTGGMVYRAPENPQFDGVYICGDYESRRLWGIRAQDRQLSKILEIGTSPAKIVSFGSDRRGGIYVIGYDLGKIYRMNFADATFD